MALGEAAANNASSSSSPHRSSHSSPYLERWRIFLRLRLRRLIRFFFHCRRSKGTRGGEHERVKSTQQDAWSLGNPVKHERAKEMVFPLTLARIFVSEERG